MAAASPGRRQTRPVARTLLPIEGRRGRTPRCPYNLGPAGDAWWRWAWHSPSATQWGVAELYTAGQRARLEDRLDELVARGADIVPTIRQSTRIDDDLGLTPAGRRALGWVVDEGTPPAPPVALDDYRARAGYA